MHAFVFDLGDVTVTCYIQLKCHETYVTIEIHLTTKAGLRSFFKRHAKKTALAQKFVDKYDKMVAIF